MSVPIEVINIGSEKTFTFKSPYDQHVKNILNNNSEQFVLNVSSITSMRDHIKTYHRDPMTDLYTIVGLKEIDYKRDLNAEVPIITFVYEDEHNSERRFRVPLSYVETASSTSEVPYVNKGIFISLDMLPLDLDLSYIFKDIEDMVSGRLGVEAIASEIVADKPTLIDSVEHDKRSRLRKNTVKIKKSNEVQLKETRAELNAIHKRLKELKIVLG